MLHSFDFEAHLAGGAGEDAGGCFGIGGVEVGHFDFDGNPSEQTVENLSIEQGILIREYVMPIVRKWVADDIKNGRGVGDGKGGKDGKGGGTIVIDGDVTGTFLAATALFRFVGKSSALLKTKTIA
jgi:hypothetical protein